jgi:hypothetical protein
MITTENLSSELALAKTIYIYYADKVLQCMQTANRAEYDRWYRDSLIIDCLTNNIEALSIVTGKVMLGSDEVGEEYFRTLRDKIREYLLYEIENVVDEGGFATSTTTTPAATDTTTEEPAVTTTTTMAVTTTTTIPATTTTTTPGLLYRAAAYVGLTVPDLATDTPIPYAIGVQRTVNSPTAVVAGGYGYFFLSIPTGKTITVYDLFMSDLTNLFISGDTQTETGYHDNTIWTLADTYDISGSALFYVTINNP